MRNALLLLALLALTAPLAARAQDSTWHGIIITHGDHVIALVPPERWVLDSANSNEMGMAGLFHEAGSTWPNITHFMYTTVMAKPPGHTVGDIIANDSAEFLKREPAITVRDGEAIAIPPRKKAVVKLYTGGYNGNDAVAYIEEKRIVVTVALTARSREEFDAIYPAFESLVRSYILLVPKEE